MENNRILRGIAASQGYGVGSAVIINDTALDFSHIEFSGVNNENKRLRKAIDSFVSETFELITSLEKSAGKKEAEILQGHISMLSDPFMNTQLQEAISNGKTAEEAVDKACNMFIDMFSSVDDALTRQRATDVKDIRQSLLQLLLGVKSVDISSVEKGSILVARDLTPSMTSRINKENVSAIITEVGGVTSHSAILARAMGIPAVLSVVDATRLIGNGDRLAVDGFLGKVHTNPDKSTADSFTEKQEQFLREKDELKNYIGKKTITSDGIEKLVYANIARSEDVESALQNDAQGIGLFRTEFLYMDRTSEPSEEEQLEAYSTVARAMDGKEVIIRTLDVGGDKEIEYLNIGREENSFLGYRAIRFCLDNPDLFKRQLRALLRASVYGNIKIMLPLVTDVNEVRKTKALIEECKKELDSEKKEYKNVSLGVMIETPSAALISDILAKEVDFFSIGTNDLTGYVMAVDRGNARVSSLYDTHNPAVLRAIEMTIKNGKKAGIMVGMCGEGASDSRLIPRLLEWGLDEFSVTPSAILSTRKTISEN